MVNIKTDLLAVLAGLALLAVLALLALLAVLAILALCLARVFASNHLILIRAIFLQAYSEV